MNLRARLESSISTLSNLALAAEERYWDGLQLAANGHFATGIYHLGFAVEMWLKYSALRFDGLSPASVWNLQSFVPARLFLENEGYDVSHESWHSLRFWSTYLRVRRVYNSRPLDSQLEHSLVHRSTRLYSVWWVSMRYFPDQADEYDIRRAYDDAGWFRTHADSLWR